MTTQKRQIHLAAGIPGVNHWTIWSDPTSGSQIDFSSFEHVARTAERGLFDYFFLAEGLRIREHKGELHDLDVAGRPDNLTALAAVAAVTTHLGLVATVSATYNEPYDVARRLATLDHLSRGRAGWNIVTTSDSFTGENFRRGGFLSYEDRYRRASEFVQLSRQLWDSWPDDALQGDAGQFLADAAAGSYRFDGEFFQTQGQFTVPRSPQRHPVLVQAGDSAEGREFAIKHVDVIFTMHSEPEAGRAFVKDVRARARAIGRDPESIKILPGASVVLGDTEKDAIERSHDIQRQQVTPQTAIAQLEQVWGTDLSSYDPEGPLPPVPEAEGAQLVQGIARRNDDRLALARAWHQRAEERGLSIRELIIEVSTRHQFVGTPSQVAQQLDEAVQSDAADGYLLSGTVVPHGIDEFVDRVVPLLQERGVYRTEYEGATFRENLGLGTVPLDDEIRQLEAS